MPISRPFEPAAEVFAVAPSQRSESGLRQMTRTRAHCREHQDSGSDGSVTVQRRDYRAAVDRIRRLTSPAVRRESGRFNWGLRGALESADGSPLGGGVLVPLHRHHFSGVGGTSTRYLKAVL